MSRLIRRIASAAALAIPVLLYTMYFIVYVRANLMPAGGYPYALAWVLPYVGAAYAWFRLGPGCPIFSRVLVVASGALMIAFLLGGDV